jgi:hypothetical protein
LSRVRFYMKGADRHHYFFIKRIQRNDEDVKDEADFEYKQRKQQLFIDDLRRFKLLPVYVNSYAEITDILRELETLYKKKTVFISGSAEEYGDWDRQTAQEFIHKLSARLIKEQLRIVNGFGWGIGSAVINGALEQIYSRPERYGEDQLIVKPFPQYKTGDKELKQLWTEYRENMIDYAGISIFLFGNKKDSVAQIIKANGVIEEFEISKNKGLFLLPIPATGYIAEDLFNELVKSDYYSLLKNSAIDGALKILQSTKDQDEIINQIINIIKSLNQ